MNGLLLWYPLDGNTSDMSGNDRHATLINANGSTSDFVDGKIFKALDLDGVDDYLSVPHDSDLDLRRTMSLSIWLKLDTIPSTGYSTIMYKGGGTGGSSRTYSLWLENSTRFFHATSADATDQQSANSANSAFTNNSWMHLVMLLDRYNGSIQVFKDKALVANDTIRTTDTVSSQIPLLFGKSQESNSDFSVINGQMDDIRLYDRVLYSFEIEDLYDVVATDSDSDGLNDAEEILLDTNLTSSDTDGDGLTDFQEVMGYHTYEQINSSLTWSAAKADAESRGGYLATITSLEEKNAIEQVRTTNSWLGGSDTQTEGNWAWVTGEPWSYTFWATGEPNGGTGENYIITWTSDGRWNDGGGGNAPYILEREYFSNPKLIDSDSDGYPDLNETQLGTDPTSYDSSPLANGLVGYWKFDETSGTTAIDSSGNDYHAQLFGASDPSAVWTTGKVGGAIQLDGSNHHLAIQTLNYNQAGQIPHVTTSVWVKTTQSSERIVMSFDRSEYWRLAVGGDGANAGKIFFASANGNGHLDVYGQTSISDGAWHHIAATYSTSHGEVRIYLDGALDHYQSAHSSQALGTGVTRFGTFSANNEDSSFNTMQSGSRSMKFNGLVDEARIYNRALSASEISILYNSASPVAPPSNSNTAPTNLVLSQSQIRENLAVGSFIGDLTATDGENDSLSYYLVSGAGDTGNSYFSLDTNGSLKTAVLFNYETNASTYSIRAQAKDPSNAATEGNFTIYLLDVDDTAPVVTLNGKTQVTHEAGTPFLDMNASWSDAVDGSGVVYASGQVDESTPGVYVLSYDYTDAAGNVAQTVIRTVNVVDTTAPLIILNGEANITHEGGIAYLDANTSWSDAVDGSGVVYASGQVNVSAPGVYVLSYDYTDAAGNVAQTVTRTVNVVDTTAPLIVLNGEANITLEAGFAYLDANASWSDAVDGSGVVYASGQVNASAPGVYVLSYDYTDAAGNVAQAITRTVNVVDTTAPLIVLNGDVNITHEGGVPYLDANASWSDAVDGSGVVYASGQVDESTPGVYVLSYNYTDAAGNVAQTVTRTVNVVDTISPIISLNGDGNITHIAGNEYFDSNASWSDAVDGSGVILASGEVNASEPGVYLLSYNYTDAAGNPADTITRVVEVINLAPDGLSVLDDISLTVFENEANGTEVARFVGVDPNPDRILSYSMVHVVDQNSTDLQPAEIFQLEENGTLLTLRPLDYEIDPQEIFILVRVTDQHDAYYEQSFVVSVLNVVEDFDEDGEEDHFDPDDDNDGFDDSLEQTFGFNPRDRWDYPEVPIIRTLEVSEQNGTLVFGAKVLSSGGFEHLDVGVSIFDESGSPVFELLQDWNATKGSDVSFNYEVALQPGLEIHYQAFAQNNAGKMTGQMLKYWIGGDPSLEKWWGSDTELTGGWRESAWLGTYLPNRDNEWIYHLGLGWLYATPDADGGLWLWMPDENWLWSRESVWPFLWSESSAGWLYPVYSSGKRYFYDYTLESIR
jgi:enamine deaminase RidA (YjgF/YER057c/UK114 family)